MAVVVNRGISATADRKVWAFVGDGEMDEPESLAVLPLAGRERLDNLIVVVNLRTVPDLIRAWVPRRCFFEIECRR